MACGMPLGRPDSIVSFAKWEKRAKNGLQMKMHFLNTSWWREAYRGCGCGEKVVFVTSVARRKLYG